MTKYDLLQSVTRKGCAILDNGYASRNLAKIRCSSIICHYMSCVIPEAWYEARSLRTLCLLSKGNFKEIPRRIISNFKYLRTLDLSASGIENLDASVVSLTLLA